jgi:hypothetical protein
MLLFWGCLKVFSPFLLLHIQSEMKSSGEIIGKKQLSRGGLTD